MRRLWLRVTLGVKTAPQQGKWDGGHEQRGGEMIASISPSGAAATVACYEGLA